MMLQLTIVVVFVFHMPTMGSKKMTLNYVGIQKDILKLKYGPFCKLLIFIRCGWMKQYDNWGNRTYVSHNVGLMVVNFRHKVPKMLEPFLFPSQTTQIFWSDEVNKPGWKMVLAKEKC